MCILFGGIYTALSGIGVQHARLNVLANNLANVNSYGYKSERVLPKTFGEVWVVARGPYIKGKQVVGKTNMGCVVAEIVTDYSQGQLVKTGVFTDLALNGQGFYVVQRDGKRLYTRNSSFSINEEGYLVTALGDPLLDEKGNAIYVGSSEFSVQHDGTVLIDGEAVAKILVVDFEDVNALKKEGHMYFSADASEKAANAKVMQGFIERSNVNLVNEMTDMLSAARTYETLQKALKTHDRLLDKAINQVGVLR